MIPSTLHYFMVHTIQGEPQPVVNGVITPISRVFSPQLLMYVRPFVRGSTPFRTVSMLSPLTSCCVTIHPFWRVNSGAVAQVRLRCLRGRGEGHQRGTAPRITTTQHVFHDSNRVKMGMTRDSSIICRKIPGCITHRIHGTGMFTYG